MATKPEQRGRGRPSIPEEERRTILFPIRVSAAELEIIKGADEQPARWARETLLKAAKRAQKYRERKAGESNPTARSRTLSRFIRPLRRQGAGRSPKMERPD